MHATITIEPCGADFLVKFPRNAATINAIKARIPKQQRAWSPEKVGWIVAPASFDTLAQIMRETFGAQIERPAIGNLPLVEETRTLKIEYVGGCNRRQRRPAGRA